MPVIHSAMEWDGSIRLSRGLTADEVVVAVFQSRAEADPASPSVSPRTTATGWALWMRALNGQRRRGWN